MGLFKSGKKSKAEKYEEEQEQDWSKKKSSRHSAKNPSKNGNGPLVRPMPQFSMMTDQFNPFSTFKTPFPINSPYDLMKSNPPPFYPSAKSYFNPIYPFPDRSPFQQQQFPLSIYQQNPFSNIQPSNYYIPPMNF